MGGVAIRLRAWSEASALDRALASAERDVASFEQAASVFRPDSFISQLNRAQGRALPASDQLVAIVSEAVRLAHESSGAFDPTVGPLVRLWRDAARAERVPTAPELAAARAHVGWQHVAVSPRPPTIALRGDAQLDLGAIAEGYLADRLAGLLRAEGIARARIDVGGDLLMFDDRVAKEPFRIGIRHPSAEGLLGELELDSGAVATSGCYERFAVVGGKPRCHVIDPRSGQPVEGTLSATVVAPSGIDADALATALLVLGAQPGLELVSRLPGIDALVVTRSPTGDGIVLAASAGLTARFTLRAKLP